MSILLVNSNAERIPLADGVVHAVVTSPPYYGLRKYAIDGGDEIGLEDTPEAYLERMVAVFREVRRVLRDDGVCWVNMGDSYSGSGRGNNRTNRGTLFDPDNSGDVPEGYKPLDLMNIPARLVLALQADGWYHRSTIIWAKPNPMPESVSGTRWERHKVKVGDATWTGKGKQGEVGNPTYTGFNERYFENAGSQYTDCPGCAKCAPHGGLVLRKGSWRPTTAHEYIYMLTKTADYFADGEAVREGVTGGTHDRGTKLSPPKEADNTAAGNGHKDWTVFTPDPVTSRNSRSVWDFPTQAWPNVSVYGRHRIASPDCRYHDYRVCPVHAPLYDEQLDAFVFPHNRDTGNCPSPLPASFVHANIESQYAPLGDEIVARYRNILHYKNDYSLKLDEISDDILAHRIAYIRFLDRCAAKYDHIFSNSILADCGLDETEIDLLVRSFSHSVCTCTYSSYIGSPCGCYYTGKVEKSTGHFASYPEELPRRCLKASISERGCCPKCGCQWARITDTIYDSYRKRGEWETREQEGYGRSKSMFQQGIANKISTTLGFLPTCDCGCDTTAPPIVLDPFAGSGTTGIVARELGAHFIGLDLSYPYLHDQARQRLGLTALDAWASGKGKQDGKVISDLPLFK